MTRYLLLFVCCFGWVKVSGQADKERRIRLDSSTSLFLPAPGKITPSDSTKSCAPFVPDSSISITFSDSVALNAQGKITFYGHVNVNSDFTIHNAAWLTFHRQDSLTFYSPRGETFSMRGAQMYFIKQAERKGEKDINLSTRHVHFYY